MQAFQRETNRLAASKTPRGLSPISKTTGGRA
jgi:hypothetical protein